MTTVFAPHAPRDDYLALIIDRMHELGTPTIRARWTGDSYQAIEGSHRLAAAHRLGLTPIIDRVDDDDPAGIECDDLTNDATVADVCEYYYSRPEVAYNFDELD